MNNYFYCGHLIQKRYGQNFLVNRFIINDIISIIKPKKEQAMVEIGPGMSALTEPICKLLDHLTVIEIDRDLVNRLRTHPFLSPKLTIYQQNATVFDFKKLSKDIGKPLRIFGNLPYNVSVKLIFHLLRYVSNITDMHFMLQKEVADRLVAKENSKTYGRLSVMVQYHCDIKSMMEVSPSAFIPSPKVKSTIVKIVPRLSFSHPVKNIHILRFVVTMAFNQRRKTIRNSLCNLFDVNMLTELGIDPRMRAENISVTQFCKLANYVTNFIEDASLRKSFI